MNPSVNLLPQGLLDGDDENVLSPSELNLPGYGFPPGTEVYVPSGSERADDTAEGWICFYEYPFKIGHRFPFSPLVQQFFKSMSVPPAQVMANVWRVLRGLDLLSSRHGLEVQAADLGHAYYIGTRTPGRANLLVRLGTQALIPDADQINDRGWRSRFFFVRQETLGEAGLIFSPRWAQGVFCFLFLSFLNQRCLIAPLIVFPCRHWGSPF